MKKQIKKRSQKTNAQADKTNIAVFLRVFAFLLPLPCYLIFTTLIFPAPNSGLLVIGYIGTLFIGISLISIAGLLDGFYFGHIVTAILFLLGSLLIGISAVVLYVPHIYALFDQQIISYYIAILASFVLPATNYILFRITVNDYILGKGTSKSTIKKLKKSKRNYWLYEELHAQYGLGVIYHVNKAFVILCPSVYILHLIVGWSSFFWLFISLVVCIVILLSSVMWVFANYYHRPKGGEKQHNKYYLTFGWLVFSLICCYAVIKYTLSII